MSDNKELQFESPLSKKLDNLYRKLKNIEEALEEAKKAVQVMQAEEKKEIFKHIPGIEGWFDGHKMNTEDGKVYDIPQNYAAKSKLVYGDLLKLIEQDGSQIFKQVEKKDRKELLAILSKKEGGWVALTDAGSYEISATAADFQSAQLNDEAIVLVPEDNLNVPYAALDEIVTTKSSENETPRESKPLPPKKKKPFPKKKAGPKPVVVEKVEKVQEDTSGNVDTIRQIDEDDLI